MKKINKTYYWIVLIVVFTAILLLRYFGFFIEIRKEFYYTIFGLLICLILLPLFGEIEFFGIKLKKEIDELKKDVKEEIRSIRFDINSSNSQQVFLGYGPPPSDNKIPQLEKEINELKEKLVLKPETEESESFKKFENLNITGLAGRFDVSESVIQLFQIRYKIESLITQIWNNHKEYFNYNLDRVVSANRMLHDLREVNLIDGEVLEITRGILSICNMAVHGKMTSQRQRDFVFKYSKTIFDTLSTVLNNN